MRLHRLKSYGLDKIITDADDPGLWQAILCRYWPTAGHKKLHVSALRFGIGKVRKKKPKQGNIKNKIEVTGISRNHLWPINFQEEYCFTRISARKLKPLKAGTNDKGMRIADLYKRLMFLDVTRPSQGKDRVNIHHGGSFGPLAGWGAVVVWIKNENGEWIETDEILSRWVS